MYARLISWSLSFLRLALSRRPAGRPARKPKLLPEQLAMQLADLSRIVGKSFAGLSRVLGLRFHGLVQGAGSRQLLGKRLNVVQRLLGVVAISIRDRLDAGGRRRRGRGGCLRRLA